MGPLLNAPWEILCTMIFGKGKNWRVAEKSLHQNIDGLMRKKRPFQRVLKSLPNYNSWILFSGTLEGVLIPKN